ncbi:MAG: hypothetical protein ACPL4E_04510 [Thermoproteota archaeon]
MAGRRRRHKDISSEPFYQEIPTRALEKYGIDIEKGAVFLDTSGSMNGFIWFMEVQIKRARALKRLVECMNKRYGKEYKYFVIKYPVTSSPMITRDGKERRKKWEVTTGTWTAPNIEECFDGEVFILSDSKYEIEDTLLEFISRRMSKTIPGYWDMDLDERSRIERKEYEEVMRRIHDRSTWDELKQKYKSIIAWLDYHDEIAREVSSKAGIEIVHYIPPRGKFTFFYSHFNSSGMNLDEKLRMIEKVLDAMDMVSREVDFPLKAPPRGYEEIFKMQYEKFDEFAERKGYI